MVLAFVPRVSRILNMNIKEIASRASEEFQRRKAAYLASCSNLVALKTKLTIEKSAPAPAQPNSHFSLREEQNLLRIKRVDTVNALGHIDARLAAIRIELGGSAASKSTPSPLVEEYNAAKKAHEVTKALWEEARRLAPPVFAQGRNFMETGRMPAEIIAWPPLENVETTPVAVSTEVPTVVTPGLVAPAEDRA